MPSYKRHFKDFAVEVAAIALMLCIVVGLCLFPARAFAAEFDYESFAALLDRANAIQNDIDAAKESCIESVQKSEEARAEKLDAEENLKKTREDLDAEKEKLNQIAIGAYKTSPSAYIETLLGAKDLQSLLDQLAFLNMLAEQRGNAIATVEELESELAEIPPKLAEKQQMELESAATAEEERKKLKSKLEEMAPELDAMKKALSNEFKNSQGTDRMYSILGYLEQVGELTDIQCSIIQQAYRMTGWGGYDNRCEAWATDCMHAAGLTDFPGYASGWDDCKANMISSDFSQAKPGCLIYGSGVGSMGSSYGHVGIIVFANGNPEDIRVCDSACSYNASQSLYEWGKWQTAVNYETGGVGLFGWGYPPGYEW